MSFLLHHVDHGGSGIPLVFLHGGSAHARWWDFVAPGFADRFRVIALDLRGHGESPWAPDGEYRIDDYAGDVHDTIAALGLEKPVWIGHSLGSFVALRAAIDRPQDVSALVLVDGRATFGPSGSRYMKLLRVLAPAEYPTLEAAVARFGLLPKETVADRGILEHVARASFRLSPSGRWIAKFDRATLSAHVPFDFREGLRTLEAPVLFVRGEHSQVLPAEAARELAASCRRGSWVEIPDAFHHVLLDRPEALSNALRAFLDEFCPHTPPGPRV